MQKRRKVLTHLSDELGKLMSRDLWLIDRLGWEEFVRLRTGRGDLTDQSKVDHPAGRLLRHYKLHGIPVRLTASPWT